MEFKQYQLKASKTAIYPESSKVVYAALGLANESGEVLGKIKKSIRDDNGDFSIKREQIADEIGDVLWYIAALCKDLDLDMATIAQNNISKLEDRQNRGVLQGSGDKR